MLVASLEILSEALPMKIYEDKYIKSNNCVIAFGNFDGVHNGHKYLLNKAKEYARFNGLDFGVYTFADSPKFAYADHSILTTLQSRLSLLEESINPDFVYLEKFDKVRDMSPCEFVCYFTEMFGCECAFCGENFRFGKNAEGTSDLLVKLMKDSGRTSVVVKSLEYDGDVVSSSGIRKLISDGEVDKAHNLLGYYFGFSSKVVHGAHLGNKLGFPTINQVLPEELVYPKYGVYASIVVYNDKEYMGVTNFGVKPTVSSGNTPVAETFIIDFDGDVYDEYVRLCFVERLRDEKTFSSLNELRDNIAENVEQTKRLFGEK